MDVWTLNLRQLGAAVAIFDTGSVSSAADMVHISQPAITQGLAKLESQLGAPLFERSPKGMESTAAGELFVPRLRAALDRIASSRVTMTQMRAFIAIADAGSYARAAQLTGLTQPSLHRAVGDLSFALKVDLVRRRGRGVALTHAGRRRARAFRLAKAELQAGLADLGNLNGYETGEVAIGAMPLSRARLLPLAISRFSKKYPSARVRVVEGAFHELIEPLRDGEIDLMIGALREARLDPEIEQQLLFHDHPAIVARKGHPAAERDGSLQSLASFPWVLPSSQTPLRQQCQAMFEAAGVEMPQVPIECGSPLMIRQLLRESDMVTVLSPEQLELELKFGVLEEIKQAPETFQRSIGMSRRIGWRPTAIQAAFLDEIVTVSGSIT